MDQELLSSAPWRVVLTDGTAPPAIEVRRRWDGCVCRSELVNTGQEVAHVREVVLFSVEHALDPDTSLYGEGFQMLSQTGGTLSQPVDLGGYTDRGHYRMAEPAGMRCVHGLLLLSPPGHHHISMAFSSCHRFSGQFRVGPGTIDVVLDTEGLALAPGERWQLEEFVLASGSHRGNLLAGLAERMSRHHPPRLKPAPPTGWCSWYCFGPRATRQQVLANLDFLSEHLAWLRYVQIDDGYQAAMGDWLDTNPQFGGHVSDVIHEIRKRGFQPAIWVAPFIAEAGSRLMREHPGWFIKDTSGRPLKSSDVTFGGWRRGPWYALDGTHPEVQQHLERVFRTMHQDWGCTYFKLDANFWGAMHGGHFHDPKATRVEAYRRGMAAILRGAGESFVLGCNHPIWPSLGMIDGSRSSGDINRRWVTIKRTAQENLSRNWQNGRLWWNDPDCLLLSGNLPADERQCHATAIYATGGMLLSGDDLPNLPTDRLAMLQKLARPTGAAAQFADASLNTGLVRMAGGWMACVFNWNDQPEERRFTLPEPCRVQDFWSGEDLGWHAGEFTLAAMPPHSARLLQCLPRR